LTEEGWNEHPLIETVEDVDTVRVYGLVSTSEEKEMIECLVKGIQGVKVVVNDLSVLRG